MANASVAVGRASVVSPAVLALLLAAAAVGTSELIIAGLLPTISLDLDVSIPIAGLPQTDCAMGLSAILEEKGGTISYWALAHPEGKPDFHAAACFAAELPAPGAA